MVFHSVHVIDIGQIISPPEGRQLAQTESPPVGTFFLFVFCLPEYVLFITQVQKKSAVLPYKKCTRMWSTASPLQNVMGLHKPCPNLQDRKSCKGHGLIATLRQSEGRVCLPLGVHLLAPGRYTVGYWIAREMANSHWRYSYKRQCTTGIRYVG